MTAAPAPHLSRTLVLVGLMGAGKSAIGRRLALRLGLPFVDADQVIEAAAARTITEIFEQYGEPAFRDVERRVIARLLHDPPHVLATGGGAFMDAGTRALIAERGLSVWLRADLDLLLARTERRGHRPLLNTGEPREVLARLIEQRYPVYALADITVDSRDAPVEETAEQVLRAVEAHLAAQDGRSGESP